MALPVVGLHNPSQATVQGHVGLGIGGEDQQVRCIWPPTYLGLFSAMIKPMLQQKVKTGWERSKGDAQTWHLADGSLDDSVEASLWGIPVPGHHLLLDFLCETANFLRQTQDVFVAKLGQAGRVYAVRTDVRWSNAARTFPKSFEVQM